MNLVALIDKILLVDAGPLVVFGEVVQLGRVYVQLRVLEAVNAFFELINLHLLAAALLQIVVNVHVMLSSHRNEQNLVRVIYQQCPVVEVNYLFGGVLQRVRVVGRLVVDWLVEVIHTKNGPGYLFVVSYELLGQEVLVRQEIVLVVVGLLLNEVVVVEVLGEHDVEGAVVLVVLYELVAVDE